MKVAPSPLPVPDATVSFWRAQPHAFDKHRTTPDLPSSADIVVIGSGYAGASTVYHILEKCKARSQRPPSILILEAREACSGATGRNGGHLKPDPLNKPASIAAEYGVEAAAEVAAFEAAHVPAIKDLVEKEQIDCDFVMTRAVDVELETPIHDRLKAGYDKLVASKMPVMKDVFYIAEKDAEGISGVKGAKGCFTYTAGHVFPYKLILHLLSSAVAQGVNLQTNTPVKEVSKDQDSNGYWTLKTYRGSVKARKIIYATNAYTSAILPEYTNRIIPVRGICSRIVPTKKPAPLLQKSYILRWNGWNYDYLIPRADGSIVVGGARPPYLHDLDSWYNVADDSKLMDSAKSYFDGYMQRHFHGWEDSGAYTDQVWTGIMGYSSDHLPHAGKVPQKENQFILAGFTGHGMPQIFLTAKGIADMVLDEIDFKDTGIPGIFQTSEKRLASETNKPLETWKLMDPPPSAKL